MAQVMVADDVLTGQPNAAMQPDLAAPSLDPETWVIDMWNSDVHFLITPASDSAGAEKLDELAEGVRRAARRFWLVDEAGEELPEEDPFHDLRTPDVVLGPLRFGSGIVIAAGTKDGVTWPLGRKFVEILREELERLDIDTLIACLPSEVQVNELAPWGEPAVPKGPGGEPGPPARRFWYVTSSATRTTSSGFRRGDSYYLRADMTWTREREEAVSFAEADRDSMIRLVEKLRADGVEDMGEPYGVLTGATTEEPHPLRPEESG